MSTDRRMNVASAFLCIFGGYGLSKGLAALFFPEQFLDSVAGMLGEGGLTLTIVHYHLGQFFGLFATLCSLLVVIISLFPYRKGEKWAWLTILLVGIVMIAGTIVLFNQNVSESIVTYTFNLAWLIVPWVIGLAIPAKEVFGKSTG